MVKLIKENVRLSKVHEHEAKNERFESLFLCCKMLATYQTRNDSQHLGMILR